jgi:hypothetical protein
MSKRKLCVEYEECKDAMQRAVGEGLSVMKELSVSEKKRIEQTFLEAVYYSLDKMKNKSDSERVQNIAPTVGHLLGDQHCTFFSQTWL